MLNNSNSNSNSNSCISDVPNKIDSTKDSECETLFQLTVWINNQFDSFYKRFEQKIKRIENRVQKLENMQIQSNCQIRKTHFTKENKSVAGQSAELTAGSISDEQSHSSTRPEIYLKRYVFLVSKDGIKWLIQGDTYQFKNTFHRFGCIWSKDRNGWFIYTKKTMNALFGEMKKTYKKRLLNQQNITTTMTAPAPNPQHRLHRRSNSESSRFSSSSRSEFQNLV